MDLFGTILLQISDCLFVQTFCQFVDYLWLLFGELVFQIVVMNQLFRWQTCVVQLNLFYHNQVMNKFVSTKSRVLISLVSPTNTGKSQLFFTFASKFELTSRSLTNFTFLSSLPATLRRFANKDWKAPVCSRCKLSKSRSVRKQLHKVLANLCKENCKSREFADIATRGRYRGFRTNYNKYILFNQSKHGRDVELLNAHIVGLKSPMTCC